MPFIKGNSLWNNPQAIATRFKNGDHRSPKTEFKKGMKSTKPMLGKKHSEETKQKMRETHKREKYRYRSWKGGITPINQKIRMSGEYKVWRKVVFERDKYICVFCGAKSGNGKKVILHADHIKPFALYPELRFAIDNGRTLCRECHKKTNTYAGRISQYAHY